jgi:branched-chain amino acid transport system ATP-binding protein
MLELKRFSCGYGLVQAVGELDLAVPSGLITVLLGPNGAGKTSTLMAIAGHVELRQGDVLFAGQSIRSLSPAERTRRGIALAPEGRRVFAELSVAENLLIGGYTQARESARETEAHVLELFPRLAERYRQRAGALSGGEQQMLAIGRALMASPRLLMIDELSLGLTPAMSRICWQAVMALRGEGRTVLVVEQNTHRALAAADRVVVLVSGRKVYEAAGEEARADPGMVDSILGLTEAV